MTCAMLVDFDFFVKMVPRRQAIRDAIGGLRKRDDDSFLSILLNSPLILLKILLKLNETMQFFPRWTRNFPYRHGLQE